MDFKLCSLYKELLLLTTCKPRVEILPGSLYKKLTRLNIKCSHKTPQNSAVNVRGYQRQQQEKQNLVPFITITEQQSFKETWREQKQFYKKPQQHSLCKVPAVF